MSSQPLFFDKYTPLFQPHANGKEPEYELLFKEGVSVVKGPDELDFLKVEPEAIAKLTQTCIRDIEHYFRSAHLAQIQKILKDPEASANDRFVALELLKNACVSAGLVLPSCQDTGTACVYGYRGERVLTGGLDGQAITKGIYNAYNQDNLRYSQVAPLSMFEEKNTGNNLPGQIELYAGHPGDELAYKFHVIAKGGGSANKFELFQKTKAFLKEKEFESFLMKEIAHFGTSACPPYHIAIVIGGQSADQTLKVAKLVSTKYYDGLPTSGDSTGRAFRDLYWEERLLKNCQKLGIGAQFGGKYFAHDVRVVRLPRHGASCPVGMGVSCSADRQCLAKITPEGVFIEKLEKNPAKYMPDFVGDEGEAYPVKTRLALTGTIIVARDIAHAKMMEMLESGKGLPDYIKKYPVYYAGPAKKPDGKPSGSFGPTTSNRMDPYVEPFQSNGGSMIMIGKGNRSDMVTDACKKNGGFYLGSIGGVAAILADKSIKKVECLDMEELGMEAVWKIDVVDFPAFTIVDDKGNDFFKMGNASEQKMNFSH
ncbi:Fumarate hydratase class I, anaerobic, putative [Perkinsus marinus ATCC 50983]|uniref:fumarate hydratase n=1 Tax=Perkinsus marinus (strain ATCC 50983 / TXsc) TaxID=423536 RepID=C5K9M8_PERM5|nr:Fumarate hydratase class I, anaerobic, putative [Perkinsus marinus ATCC 50983]EER18800.1 Fumarate hydratase class I, anaerobic, putative [Perkinsus marinus ATCC 50983]|eukprot:XP_002787004.1 Fumarate hydratase class I, anaerobic, putative [Perkinsus marinus ATCC 50983]